MKHFLPIFCLLLLFTNCKKAIEKAKENAIVSAMTDGQWVITSFIDDGTDITSNFSPYKFQYYANRTVDAINNGTVEKTGNWEGDANAMAITATFPSASNPLLLINGTWHIDDNSWTYVVASLTTGGKTKTMRLQKL